MPQDPQLKPLDRLHEALTHLGLSFAESFRLVRYDPQLETACWGRDGLGHEWIAVGPTLAAFPLEQVEMVLRHEFLHRATFHGQGEALDDPRLANLVLDICINHLLYRSSPGPMRRLCLKVYPPAAAAGLLNLCNGAAEVGQMPEVIRELWQRLYQVGPNQEPLELNPTALYYRLLPLYQQLHPQGTVLEVWPVRVPGLGHPITKDPLIRDEAVKKALREVAADLRRNRPQTEGPWRAAGIDTLLRSRSLLPEFAETADLSRYLHRLEVQLWVDKVKLRLSPETGDTKRPYPIYPNYRGLVFQAQDLSRYWGYYGRSPDLQKRSPALNFYLDVSGSMTEFYPKLMHLVERFREFALRFFAFDTELIELDPQAVAAGQFPEGGGTDFDPPVRHFLDDPQAGAGIVFTDGLAEVSPDLAQALSACPRALNAVFFGLAPGSETGSLGAVVKSCFYW